ACIIIWSMANETPISDARNAFIKNLVDHTKSLDNTRLISAALLTQSDSAGFGTINDAIGDYLDIISFNQYLGWYGGNLEDAEKKKKVFYIMKNRYAKKKKKQNQN